MVDNLIGLLETLKVPVIKQGSLAPNEPYPETFITFWGRNEDEHSAYDNETQLAEYDFDVNVYSTSPNTAYTMLESIRQLLKANGYIITTRGFDVQSDEPTHTGRGLDVAYLKTEN